MNRKAILVAGSLLFVSLVTFLFLFFRRPDPRRADAEQYAVYSAYLAPEINENYHDYGSGNGFVLLIQQKTANENVLSPRVQRLSTEIPALEKATLSNFLMQSISRKLLSKRFNLPVQYDLLNEDDLSKPDSIQARFPQAFGQVTLSSVGFNKNLSQALFYTEHLCGLCGGGGYVLMEKTMGHWRVKAFRSTWVS